MCGVYLRIAKADQIELNEGFDKLNLNQIKSRGPDGTFTLTQRGGQIMMGFTRLSIRAIESGNQPYEDKRFISAFNGEIYNCEELINKIKIEYPNEVIPEGDAQLLGLWLFLFGPQSINDVVGMFAGYLQIKNKIYAFRDRVGEKPLYYGFHLNSYFISSCLPLATCSSELMGSKELISGVSDYKICEDLFSLSPGTFLEVNQNTILEDRSILTHQYWSWPKRRFLSTRKNFDSAFESSVIEAVKSQLVSDAGMSILLSGGVDSGLVAAIARKECGNSLTAFTLSFKDSEYDESNRARETAHYLKLNHEVIEVTSEDLSRNVQSTLDAMDVPIYDTGCLSLFTLSKWVSKFEKVALTGDGGDELFRGYSIFKKSLIINILKTFNFNISLNFLIKIIDFIDVNEDDYLGKILKLRRAQSITKNRNLNPLFAALGPLGGTDLFDLIASSLGNQQSSSRKVISNRFIENYYINEILPKIYLLKSDKMSMAHGLELRAPLLNHKVIECAYELTEFQLLISPRKAKLRKMAERYLSKSILTSKKHGFSTPFHHVVRFIDEPEWLSHRSGDELAEHKRIWSEAKKGNEWAAIPAWSLLVKEHFFMKTLK